MKKFSPVSKKSDTLVCKKCNHLCYCIGYAIQRKVYGCGNCTKWWTIINKKTVMYDKY